MHVTGIWSAVGAGIVALMVGSALINSKGTTAAFNGVTGLETSFGNQVVSGTSKAA
jgi:hypothetical protein